MNFWQKLTKDKKPFLCLAPMEGVTDTVFRQIVDSCARPAVRFTEFTNVEGILHDTSLRLRSPLSYNRRGEGGEVLKRLIFAKSEHPIIAQIWGNKPESFYQAAKIVVQMNFDGIDINMGCPVKKIIKHGSCSDLIKNPNLAKEIIAATKQGAGKLSVSVKTRLGFNKIMTEEWCGFLLEQKLDALTIHARTVKEMSAVPAHWDEIAKVVNLRDQMKSKTIIIGNGDVENLQDAKCKVQIANVDGIMIGRGVLSNPWAFSGYQPTVNDRLNKLAEHLKLHEQTWGDLCDFNKKFFKVYVQGFEGASEVRERLYITKTISEIETILAEGVGFEPTVPCGTAV